MSITGPRQRVAAAVLGLTAVVTGALLVVGGDGAGTAAAPGAPVPAPPTPNLAVTTPVATTPVPTTPVPTTIPPRSHDHSAPTTVPDDTVPYDGLVDPASVGSPWGDEVRGLLTFRGNPTRTYYGSGPVPASPGVDWTYEIGCSSSTVGGEARQWCGSGWTGQPAVFERDGRTWVTFGAYDRNVHFLDADTGAEIIPPFPTGDIIKGSVTVDPDGYPLLYTGSRDGRYRVIAFDRDRPTELWALAADAVSGTRWNDDWDGAGLILDGLLIEGGENSVFHVARLHRGYGPDGRVTVDPELIFDTPGYDAELVAAVGDNVSIEGSVAVSGDVAYFANSGGLVQGWDLAPLAAGGQPERVFRYWAGDDIDASIVVDDEGFLYVGVEWERDNARAEEVGQILKLDPSRPDDPLVWSVADRGVRPGGVWATPALHGDLLVVPTNGGRLLGIDRTDGRVRWEEHLPGPLWSSPVVVDGVLIQGDCDGVLHGYDVSDTTAPPLPLWSVDLGGCIESTPAVWDGGIYVGTRSGTFFALHDADAATAGAGD